MDVDAVVAAYLEAWHALDEGTRREALERCWADEGTYSDPTWQVTGRDEFAQHLAGFRERLPGTRFERGEVDAYGAHLRFAWRLLNEDGTEVLRGTDYGRVDDSGRLVSVVGFFGDLASLP